MAFAIAAGIEERRIILDPGIGFGKTIEHNLELLRRLDELVAIGRPLMIGTSRKSFLGQDHRPRGPRRAAGGDDRLVRDRVRAGRACIQGPRGRAGLRRAEGDGCYGRTVDDEADEYDEVDDERGRGSPRARGHDRDQRPLAVHTRRGHRRRAPGRSAAAARPADRRRRGRRHRHRPDRGHRRLQPGLPDGQPGRAAALLQDARAAVRGDRRSGDRASTTRTRCGSRRRSPSRRWRCRSRRYPSRCGARANERGRPRARGPDRLPRAGFERGGPPGASATSDRGAAASTESRSLPRALVYETEPVGLVLDQREFFNACVRIETALEPERAARRVQGGRASAWAGARRHPARPAADRRRRAAARRPGVQLRAAVAPAPGGQLAPLRAGAAAGARPGPGAPGRRTAGGRARGARRRARP